MTPSNSTTAPARGSRTAAESAATSSGSPVTRTRRTVPSPPLTGGTSATSSPGAIRDAGVGVLAVDRGDAGARRELHRGEQIGDGGVLGQLDVDVRGARALAQAGEETDGDEHARSLGSRMRRQAYAVSMEAELTHLDAAGTRAHGRREREAADRALRPRPRRRAHVARRPPRASPRGDNPKGDVASVARIAAIQAAKRTDELIPLAHSLPLTHVDPEIEIDADAGTVTIVAVARCADRTGVEMEAMVACSVGALTVYDMVKGIEPGVVIERVELLDKTGGKSDFHRA